MFKPINLEYKDLNPYIDEEVINIQYNIYLDNLKKLNNLVKNEENKENIIKNIDKYPILIRDDILYYVGSVLNHELYFNSISNKKNNELKGKLKDEIIKEYGSFNNFKEKFMEAASYVVGSGYTFLVSDYNGKLNIINTSNEENPYYYDLIPIMTIDLWEHAYFLKYRLNKKQYIKDFFEIVDFDKINETYEKKVK